MRRRVNLGKSYEELIKLKTFDERYKYLRIGGTVGEATFGGERYLNQVLYTSHEWRIFRRDIIIRDLGRDLAMEDYEIHGLIIIHHINPIDVDDVINRNPCIFDPNNVVCTSDRTHKAIHYGDIRLLPSQPIIRRPNDHCPWKQ